MRSGLLQGLTAVSLQPDKHRSLVREALHFCPAGHRAVGDYGGLKPTLRLP